MNGQLTPSERDFLHKSILEYKPRIVLEVGTWKGGGSTWQITTALEKNGFGLLHTCETEKEFFDEANDIYKGNRFIKLWNMHSNTLIMGMISRNQIPDFIFFDGPEDEETAFKDLLVLLPVLEIGALFSMHDFDPPSIKASNVRPYLENSPKWTLISKLTAPESVGICLYKKIS